MNIVPSLFDTVILAIIQGVTELLPISSSAFLIFYSQVTNNEQTFIHLDVVLHFATLCAIILVSRKTIYSFIKGLISGDAYAIYLLKVSLYGTVPTLVLGYILYTQEVFLTLVRTSSVIAFTFIFFGFLLILADRNTTKIDRISSRQSLFVGLGQAISLIPGVSRSGIIITVLRGYGISRTRCFEILLFLSIPVILASTILVVLDTPLDALLVPTFGLAFAVAFCTFLAVVCGIRRYIEKIGFAVFGYIRICIGLGILGGIYLF